MACEDAPCCGHEANDCDGTLYGSSEDIAAEVYRQWGDGHGMCDHEVGLYMCDDTADRSDDAEDEDWADGWLVA